MAKFDKIEKMYAKTKKKYPNITNARHIELLTRDIIMRRNKIKMIILCSIGLIAYVFWKDITAYNDTTDNFLSKFLLLFSFVAIIGYILGVLGMAKALHDPLTPNEESELASFDAVEKGVIAKDERLKFDYSGYLIYEEQKYLNASFFKKISLLANRISIFGVFVIISLVICGGAIAVKGGYNILTYEERNKNAVTISAKVVDKVITETDEDSITYKYTYEYVYDDEKYEIEESSREKLQKGTEKEFLIDSTNPAKVILNNGQKDLKSGITVLAIGIIIFIFSLFKVRNPYSNFSILSLLWLVFVAAAVGFGIWGTALILMGYVGAGMLVILIGCPIWLLAAVMFKSAFS